MLPRHVARPSKKANDRFSLGPQVLGLALAVAICLWRPGWLDIDTGNLEDDPADVRPPSMSSDPGVTSRALRGTSSDNAATFKWIFPDDPFVAGVLVRTRVVALDGRGRTSRLASCDQLRVNLTFSGSARLVQQKTGQCTGGELRIDIENEAAEVAEAHLRIEDAVSTLDVFRSSSKLNFVSGPPEKYDLHVWPVGVPLGKESSRSGSSTPTVWPTDTVLDAVVVARDRFGNSVRMDRNDTRSISLRSNSASLKVLNFFRADDRGEARARIRSAAPGRVEVWVEHDSKRYGGSFRDDTIQRLEFLALSRSRPRDILKEARASSHMKGSDTRWLSLADEVRNEFLHAWNGYRKYAWGEDELMPVSQKGKDVFGNIGITILDTLTTLWIMGLSKEFDEATAWVTSSLNFHKANRQVSFFEIVIRALGGLLGAHALSGRPVFLERAIDLGERLLPALNTSSGMPLPEWDLSKRRGTDGRKPTILAEAGSLQLEFRYLTAVSGDTRFREAADRSFKAIAKAGASAGLVPVHLTPPNVLPTALKDDKIGVGGLADSYYEYLLKQWIQSPGEPHFKDMFIQVVEELQAILVRGDDLEERESAPKHASALRIIEMTSKRRAEWKMEHLSCFIPGAIALALQQLPSKDLDVDRRTVTWRRLAEGLGEGCGQMWTQSKTGLAPEHVHVKPKSPYNIEIKQDGFHSFIRPETAESLFYLYRLTGDEHYRSLGEQMFRAIVKHSKVPGGYASVRDVNKIPTDKMDEMQSFIMAETFKYLFLLFSPDDALDLDKFVLNTEGHPLQKLGPF